MSHLGAKPSAHARPEELWIKVARMLLGSFHLGGKTGSGSSLRSREAQGGCEVCFWSAGRPLCSSEQNGMTFPP